jgi:hypothetical protein
MKPTVMIALLMCFSATQSFAKGSLDCELKVLSSICGSGSIFLRLNQYGSFELDYGDIGCWYQNVRYKGGHTELSIPSSGINTKFYKLVATTNVLGASIDSKSEIGTVEYDSENQVALLSIDEQLFGGARGKRYHLQCEGEIQ